MDKWNDLQLDKRSKNDYKPSIYEVACAPVNTKNTEERASSSQAPQSQDLSQIKAKYHNVRLLNNSDSFLSLDTFSANCATR